MQFAASEFVTVPLGHNFVLRKPLARATANKCAECGIDIRQHARREVTDEQLLAVLSATDDGTPTVILEGEMSVGGYKAVLRASKEGQGVAVVNCAGTKMHAFLPSTQKDCDLLRSMSPPRLLDVEWEDSEDFEIQLHDVINALAWARAHVAAGRVVLINCMQGKSRSGTLATAYLMAKWKLGVDEALSHVQKRRPIVQPNPAFMRTLRAFEADIRALPVPVSLRETRLREVFAKHVGDGVHGLNVNQVRAILVASGESANDAKSMVSDYDCDQRGFLTEDEFVLAWGNRPVPSE